MSSISGNVKTRKIEYSSEDFQNIEDALNKIRALAMRARMATEKEARLCLKDIIFQTNYITNQLLNGEIMDAVELSR